MSSSNKVNLGGLYINAHKAVYICKILESMGHPQPKMSLQTDNNTAEGVVNKKVQPKHTKAMEMQFHWMCNHVA